MVHHVTTTVIPIVCFLLRSSNGTGTGSRSTSAAGSGPQCQGIRHWNTSVYNFPPFVDVRDSRNTSGAMYQVMVDMLVHCCNWKQGLPQVELRLANARTLEENLFDDVMFALPVTRNAFMAELYSMDLHHTFIPIIHTQGPMLIVNEDTMEDALTSSLKASYPLLLLVLCSAGIAAIMIWLLDHQRNPASFPTAFLQGFWEGIWWAYVTMTTVGYGDKTPRSLPGRLFGLVWITMGIVIMSVFTATLAATFTTVTSISTDIRGMRIGVVNGSEEYVVSFSNGARTYVYDNYKVLLEAASQADVLDGMLVDRFYHLFQTHVFHAYNLKIVGAISSPAVHGILVYNDPENPSLTSCLSGYVASHKFSIYDYIESLLQAAERRTSADHARSIITPQARTLYITAGVLCAMFLLGVAYDLGRRLTNKKNIGRVFNKSPDSQDKPPPKPPDNTCMIDMDKHATS